MDFSSLRPNCALIPVALIVVAGCSGSQVKSGLLPSASQQIPSSANASGRTDSVAIWVTSRSQNEIFGEDLSGKKTVLTIDGATNGCYGPNGIKVDHHGNLWVACYSSSAYTGFCFSRDIQGEPPGCVGSIEMYAPGSQAPSVTYQDSRCAGRDCTDWSGAAPNDVALNSRGTVFAATPSSSYCVLEGSSGACGQTDAGAYSYWIAGKSSKRVHFRAIGNLKAANYLDVDAAGNLYISGSVKGNCGSSCRSMVDEIGDPTSQSPTIAQIIGPTRDQLGGIYVSKGGLVLNVVDETARTISQYALPWVTSEAPFNVLGPTLEQMGHGEPTSGGFDPSEKHLVLGDADGWMDIGNVAGNRWSAASNKKLKHGNYGAAYVPSDK